MFFTIFRPMQLLCAFCVCLLLVCSGTAHAAAASLDDEKAYTSALIQAMQESYAQLRSLKATFVQKLTHQESGAVETRTGILWFQLPLRMRWDTQKPEQELLIVSEKEIWNYLPEDNIAYRYAPDLARDSRSIIQVITGQSRLDQDFTVSDAGRSGDYLLLYLSPKEPTLQFTECNLWIDAKTKLVYRAVITDFYGNINDITLEDSALNVAPPVDAFTFIPPAGVKVEDRTTADATGIPLLQ